MRIIHMKIKCMGNVPWILALDNVKVHDTSVTLNYVKNIISRSVHDQQLFDGMKLSNNKLGFWSIPPTYVCDIIRQQYSDYIPWVLVRRVQHRGKILSHRECNQAPWDIWKLIVIYQSVEYRMNFEVFHI